MRENQKGKFMIMHFILIVVSAYGLEIAMLYDLNSYKYDHKTIFRLITIGLVVSSLAVFLNLATSLNDTNVLISISGFIFAFWIVNVNTILKWMGVNL